MGKKRCVVPKKQQNCDMFGHGPSGLLSVHIGSRSEIHPRIDMNSHPEESDMNSCSGKSSKTCRVGAAFVFESNQIRFTADFS